MFNMKADYSENEKMEFTPLPTNDYECMIQTVQEQVTPNKKESLSIRLVVRNDLDMALPETNGAYHNRILFDNHWKRDTSEGYVYHIPSLMYVLEAVGVPENTEINSVDELIKMITGKPVKVYIKEEWSEYNQAQENSIAPWGYSKSDYPNSQHKFDKDDTPTNRDESNPFSDKNATDIDDSDLPF